MLFSSSHKLPHSRAHSFSLGALPRELLGSRHGEAWRGRARQGEAWLGKARRGSVQGEAGHGKAGPGWAGRGSRQGVARQGRARLGRARHGAPLN